jgi:hypothetical protein
MKHKHYDLLIAFAEGKTYLLLQVIVNGESSRKILPLPPLAKL